MTTAELLEKLSSVTKNGTGWKARCPAHEDSNPSLSVSLGADDKILLRCFAGCTFESILASLSLKPADLFPCKSAAVAPRIVATYDYVSETGELIYQVVRFDPKNFKQRRPDAAKPDSWIWNLNGSPRPIYRWPEVKAAIAAGRMVFVAEGEKDCDALTKAGFTATCNSGGAGKWTPEHGAALAGAERVVVIADRDKAGRDHARAVATALRSSVKSLAVLELPDLGERKVKDAADFFNAGGEAADLWELAETAPEFSEEEYRLPDVSDTLHEPEETRKPLPPPKAELLGDVQAPDPRDDQEELLRHRFLCRGAGLLFCGPTGIGKSSFALQAAVLWSLGRDCFGITPARPLRSLMVQSENDDGDVCEMRAGVFGGLSLNSDEVKKAGNSIWVTREDSRTGFEFIADVVRPLLQQHPVDLLWLDPILAFLGAEASAQRDVTPFLRNHLNPLIREFNCGVVVVHHTNKPPSGREKPNWSGSDFAYVGSGSIEWANWSRAVLSLRSLGSHDVFELRAGKRGSRLGWRESDGSTAYAKQIAHAKGGSICWREAGADEIDTGGRPKSFDADEILGLLPPEGLTAGDWQETVLKECGVKETTFHRHRRTLEGQNRILKSKVNGKWMPILKP